MPKLKKVIAGLAFGTACAGGALAVSASAAGAATVPMEYGYANPVYNVFDNGYNNTFRDVRNTACYPSNSAGNCGYNGYGVGYNGYGADCNGYGAGYNEFSNGFNNTFDNVANNVAFSPYGSYGQNYGAWNTPYWNDCWWENCFWANRYWNDCNDGNGYYN